MLSEQSILFESFKKMFENKPGPLCVKLAGIIKDSISVDNGIAMDTFLPDDSLRVATLSELSHAISQERIPVSFQLKYVNANLIDDWKWEQKLRDDQWACAKYQHIFGDEKKGSPPVQNAFIYANIDEGRMTACCPYSGEVVESKKSFPIYCEEKWLHMVFFRFQGEKTFYVVSAGYPGMKAFVFLPDENLIIVSIDFMKLGYVKEYLKYGVKKLYYYYLLFVEETITYLQSKTDGTGIIYGLQSNLGHFITNEYTGVSRLAQSHLFDKMTLILSSQKPKIEINKLFCEIEDKSQLSIKFFSSESELFHLALIHNKLWMYPCASYVNSDDIFRMRFYALTHCGNDQRILINNTKGKDVLFVNLRRHNKSWENQVEGTINLAKKLYESHEKLALFLDGYSDCEEDAENITSSLSPLLPVYNGLNISLAETICWALRSDYYVCVVGSGLILLTCIANKPGVAYADPMHMGQVQSGGYWSGLQIDMIQPLPIELREIVVTREDKNNITYSDYKFSWQDIFVKLAMIFH